MTKMTKRLLCGLLCLVLCVSSLFVGCRQEEAPATEPTATAERVLHTVTVKNTADEGMEGLGVYVYTDETMTELVWFAKTDAQGAVTFNDIPSDSYVAVLADVPQGYQTEEMYPLTGTQTEIVLESGLLSGDDLETIKVGLGDMMFDFTITDTDGNTHTLSQLLREKDAVVLNFWFLECQPCKAEFPYLQQAYEKYSDRIAVLALNPVNSDEDAVAQYKADLGLTFPVAVVDPQWAETLGITAYPTTVVIDRFGTVTLVHTGSIPSTEGFEAIFETFVGEDYTQDVVEDPEAIIPVVGTKGSAEDPYEFGGVTSFEVTVEPGKTVYVRLYKAFDMYMQIKSGDAVVMVGDKTYEPTKGKVGLTVNCEDTYTPLLLQIGNTGTETQTFTVTLSSKSGTIGNPKTMSLGDFTVKVNAGNEQGVYYSYRAEKDGILTLECLEGTAGVKYNFALYNLSSYAYRTLDADGEGNSLSVKVKKGQNIQFIMFTVPDESFKYPAGTFQMRATLGDSSGDEEEEVVQTGTYSVLVKDETGAPMANVKMLVKGESYTGVLTTDDTGVASATLPLGDYTATITVPAGYTAENNAANLTAETLSGEVVLTKVVVTYTDYKVTVLSPDGVTPVENAMVIVGEALAYTDAAGSAVVNLETGAYNVYLSNLSSDYSTEESYYAFPEGSCELTITLIYTPGTENNPIIIDSNPYTTEKISKGKSVYYHAYNVGGMILTIEDADAYVIYNGVTYGADANGRVTVVMESTMPMMPNTLVLGNSGTKREAYTLTFSYPAGHRENPIVLEDIASFVTELAEGDEDGVYYSWTPAETGTVTFRIAGVESETANVVGDVSINDGMKLLSCDGVADENGQLVLTVDVTAGEPVSIQVLIPVDMETWTISAGKVTVAGAYVREDTDITDPTESTTEATEETTEATEETTEATEETTEATEETTEATGETTEATEAPTEPTTEPTEPETDAEYVITVTDYAGEPVSGIVVAVYNKAGSLMQTAVTDENGEVIVELERADYTVKLLQTAAYYEQSTAVLTAMDTELTILLAEETDSGAIADSWAVEDGQVYQVSVGGTHVRYGSGQVGYDTEKGVTLFYFTAEEAGIYRFTTSNPDAVISYWSTSAYPFNATSSLEDYANNAFTLTVKENQVGNITYVLGISGSGECALIITRLGDPAFDPDEVPYTAYTGTIVPAAFTYTGGELTDVDYTGNTGDYTLVLNDKDGLYHIGSKDGPILYVNLVSGRFISLYNMVNGQGNIGAQPFRAAFYNAKGEYIKEDYTELMQQYTKCADPNTGVYPVNEELMYILQKGIAHNGWTDSSNPNYLFKDDEGNALTNVNPDLAWMFLFCYEAQ